MTEFVVMVSYSIEIFFASEVDFFVLCFRVIDDFFESEVCSCFIVCFVQVVFKRAEVVVLHHLNRCFFFEYEQKER